MKQHAKTGLRSCLVSITLHGDCYCVDATRWGSGMAWMKKVELSSLSLVGFDSQPTIP